MLVLSRHEPRYVVISQKGNVRLNENPNVNENSNVNKNQHPLHLPHALPYQEWIDMYEYELDDVCQYIMKSLEVEAKEQGYTCSLNYALLLKETSRYLYNCSSCVSKRWRD